MVDRSRNGAIGSASPRLAGDSPDAWEATAALARSTASRGATLTLTVVSG
jgi:hypothetical protein